ncbi:hypothetical protein BCV72DRAFT_241924 [Rhizopus microsporus var. microsporus]|uniref:Helitron helicase-like domain-containing protein n=2 Tax=Rhizopus microsporus TaxID=58291 RepID=A0A2G4SXT1_RHIZD|nr:uncharacterized protein RHIMIDRAFT_250723 [Rhizopus microsporus ATCC 52813]ORE06587.1 hypothetical protein BCV72DRAFT_241924 [Rhizopus microsporus var. microsporus]PHZ13555.1 hypothetical protein RHIMIDRAFT_250723 [Rhizopus microsporus ATCC 52813]
MDAQGRHFKDKLHRYNAVFAFTSFEYDIVSDEDRTKNSGNNNSNRSRINVFQIYGALCHHQGALTPVKGSEAFYAQLYIFDSSYAAEWRQARNGNLDPEFIRVFSYACPISSMRMCLTEGGDRRTLNFPTMEEIVAVIPIEYGDRGSSDIVLTLRGNNSLCQNIGFEQYFKRVSQAHAAYMSTQYIILFPHGTSTVPDNYDNDP